jgi:hypothetical protein
LYNKPESGDIPSAIGCQDATQGFSAIEAELFLSKKNEITVRVFNRRCVAHSSLQLHKYDERNPNGFTSAKAGLYRKELLS